MTPEQVKKSIGQMRQIFGFFGILTVLGAVLSLIGAGDPRNTGGTFVGAVLYGAWACCLWAAFSGLGKRSPSGYKWARVCSVIFLLGFPVLTFFGVSYLNKLSKSEMKQALGVGM